MLVSLFVNIIALSFAWLDSKRIFKHGLKLSFITIFIFLALRYDFGNDYLGYFEIFNKVNNYYDFSFSWIPEGEKQIEPGWVILNQFFSKLGFFTMIAFLSAINCFVLYRFIKKYVPFDYYWLAVFVYVFFPYNMVVLSSAMRQNAALLCFIVAIDFLVNRKIILYLFTIYVATLFHTSAYILFPIALLSFFRIKVNLFTFLFLIVSFSAIVTYKDLIFERLFEFVVNNDLFSVYSDYVEEGEIELSSGFMLSQLIFAIILIKSRKFESSARVFTSLGILFIIVSLMSLALPMISRFNLYFGIVFLLLYPLTAKSISNKEIRFYFLTVFILFTIYNFYLFFHDKIWIDKFYEYKTIFSSPKFN